MAFHAGSGGSDQSGGTRRSKRSRRRYRLYQSRRRRLSHLYCHRAFAALPATVYDAQTGRQTGLHIRVTYAHQHANLVLGKTAASVIFHAADVHTFAGRLSPEWL